MKLHTTMYQKIIKGNLLTILRALMKTYCIKHRMEKEAYKFEKQIENDEI